MDAGIGQAHDRMIYRRILGAACRAPEAPRNSWHRRRLAERDIVGRELGPVPTAAPYEKQTAIMGEVGKGDGARRLPYADQ